MTDDRIHDQVARVFHQCSLDGSDWEFCCIPIVMGPEFVDLYPPRTTIDTAKHQFFHSPQLSFQIFLSGTDQPKCSEFVRGIGSAEKGLRNIGLSKEQIEAFRINIGQLATA